MDEKEFKKKWLNKIADELKEFPDDFLTNIKTEEINLGGKFLMPGAELFGFYEILDAESNLFMQTGSKIKQKYILYASRNKPDKIKIPADEKNMETVVKNYEQHLFAFLKEMRKDFRKNFHSTKNFNEFSASVFNSLNLHLY